MSEPTDRPLIGVLREVIETLSRLDRTPCSPGERRAAEWLAERLRAVDGVEVALEEEPSWGTFPPTATAMGAAGTLAALLAVRGRRRAATLLALLAAAGIVDEAQNGPRLIRRVLRRRRSTINVVARAGDEAASQTLVVIAHHDAAQSGVLFDQTAQRRIHALAPGLLGRAKRPLPQWWLGLAAPLAAIVTACTRHTTPARLAWPLGALGTALVADIWRRPTVPGANDNLSGVAALVALAELLGEEQPQGLRVLLVSCGAEETLQDGIRAFLARHRDELPVQSTRFVNLDTIGSPHLAMLEGEGPIWMEDHAGPWLRDRLEAEALRLGIPLERGLRARASSDSIVPSRAGYPTATLVSLTDWRLPANYHLPSDVPENIVYETVLAATALVHELVRTAAEPLPRSARAALAS